MKARTAVRQLGGQRVINAFAKKVSAKYGVSVAIVPCVNEEEPSDNWLNVVIETPNGLFDKDGHSTELDKATDEVIDFLHKKDLVMDWECGGDGDTGPIESYRVY